jgi:ATP-dependent DNA ligase
VGQAAWQPDPDASSSPDWLHEIKYDGYRLRVERNGDRVRLIMRGGYQGVAAAVAG